MEDLHKEEEFYKNDGWPTETLRYCDYRFYNGISRNTVKTLTSLP